MYLSYPKEIKSKNYFSMLIVSLSEPPLRPNVPDAVASWWLRTVCHGSELMRTSSEIPAFVTAA